MTGPQPPPSRTENAEPQPPTGTVAIRGIRWALWLNLVTLPMSFVTNLVLGRSSAEVLGLYSAIQIFIGGFQTFFILGGNAVFTRFVPTMDRGRRIAFLATYSAIVFGMFTAVWAVARLAAPDALTRLLGRFGSPSPLLAYGVAATVVVWAFASHFLYGVERAPRAAVALKVVIVGYFGFSLACLTPLGPRLLTKPASSLWLATAVIYASAAALALAFVRGSRSSWSPGGVSWFLPAGFWSVVLFTHLGTVVEFIYNSLSPSVVLLWLDVSALGHLSAALRWVGLVALVPGMVVAVLAPGLARLESSGLRDDALRQVRAAVRVSELAVVPAVFAFVLFAPEFMGVFGPEYREHATLLRFASLSALAGPAVFVGSGLVIAFGALRSYLSVSLAYVVVSVALNLVLIPRFGLPGAAAATALSAAAQCGVVTIVTRRLGYRPPRTTALSWIFGFAVLALGRFVEPGWLVAGACWTVTTAAFYAAAGVTRGEVALLAARAFGRAS